MYGYLGLKRLKQTSNKLFDRFAFWTLKTYNPITWQGGHDQYMIPVTIKVSCKKPLIQKACCYLTSQIFNVKILISCHLISYYMYSWQHVALVGGHNVRQCTYSCWHLKLRFSWPCSTVMFWTMMLLLQPSRGTLHYHVYELTIKAPARRLRRESTLRSYLCCVARILHTWDNKDNTVLSRV